MDNKKGQRCAQNYAQFKRSLQLVQQVGAVRYRLQILFVSQNRPGKKTPVCIGCAVDLISRSASQPLFSGILYKVRRKHSGCKLESSWPWTKTERETLSFHPFVLNLDFGKQEYFTSFLYTWCSFKKGTSLLGYWFQAMGSNTNTLAWIPCNRVCFIQEERDVQLQLMCRFSVQCLGSWFQFLEEHPFCFCRLECRRSKLRPFVSVTTPKVWDVLASARRSVPSGLVPCERL